MSRKTCPNCSTVFDVLHTGRRKGQEPGRRKYCCYRCQYEYNTRNYKRKVHWREHQLLREYGITVEEYNQMFENQNGCCAICERHQTEFKKKLAVDHCHSSGEVRGLLCTNCNTILGHSKDRIDRLEAAIRYLEKSYE